MRSLAIAWLVAAGCGSGVLSTGGGGHWSGGGGGGSLVERPDRSCEVRPNKFTSWRDSFELAPTCPSEGWVRQVVRDIGEIDDCYDGPYELQIDLVIDKRGHVRSASVPPGEYAYAGECISTTMLRWELAPGQATGYLRVFYRPPRVEADVRDRVLAGSRLAAVSEEREANRPDVARVDRGLPL